MRDILAPDSDRWRRFVDVFAGVVEPAGYGLIVPPVMEDIGVFQRVGEATDVVSKEMYQFTDLGGRHVALRPEFTAGVCRAFVQHRPTTPWKTWCWGSSFRYEKPQRGRYRQFDQVDIEVLGVDDPYVDVEVIALGWRFFAALGLRQVTLLLNSLGEPADRARYVDALRDHFGNHLDALSAESRETLARNPLRVLDSKRAADAPVIAAAPQMADFLSDGAAEHFATVRAGLAALDIPFRIEPRLVRGLDYYLRTTFEYAGGTLDSAQNALGGGGRYDGLVEALGGPPTPGVGFALGIDRTLLACDDEGVFARAGAVGRGLRRRHDRRRRGPRRHRRAAPRRALRRPRLRRAQHEGADEGRRPQRRRRRRDHRRRRAGGRHRRRPAAARRRPQSVVARTDLLSHLEAVLR